MRTYIVAAFAETPDQGNPAGVCILDGDCTADQMQSIARALNQPETAFVSHTSNSDWAVRWFSPQVEVALCGHATLAAAHVLWTEGLAPAEATLRFRAAAADLVARHTPDGLIWLDLPALPGIAASPPRNLLACVNIPPIATARHADRWLLEYATAGDVRGVSPDFAALIATGARSLIVTARSDTPTYDIVSRNFAPIVGVPEDQVTGTAHAALACHWQSRLGTELRCWQASRRGGALVTRLVGDRVALGGRACIAEAAISSSRGA